MSVAFEEDFIVLREEFRQVLQVVTWPVVLVGLLGNLAVVVRIILPRNNRNNLKPFYQSSLVSLAAADLLMLATTGTNVLANLSGRTYLWKLPSAACTLIPYLQTVAMIVASSNLAFVAIDRFYAIRAQLPGKKSWNSLGFLVLGAIFTWGVALGSSYPVLKIYNTEAVTIINNSTAYPAMLCLVNDRQSATAIYTALFTVIFLPLAGVFICVYVLLAVNIYRKKVGSVEKSKASESSISQEISTASTSASGAPKPANKKIPIHVRRKRRTVRVILTLIAVFVLCRMPQWSFLLVKLYVKVSHKFWWHLQVVLTLLSLINAAVHPFLYAFLNEALSLVSWIYSLCLSKPKKTYSDPQIISIKIPRGPYRD